MYFKTAVAICGGRFFYGRFSHYLSGETHFFRDNVNEIVYNTKEGELRSPCFVMSEKPAEPV